MAQDHSRVPELVDILLNAAIVISTIVMLYLSWNEHPTYSVRFWICGVALLSISQIIINIIVCNAPDHEGGMYCKVCSFALSFVLMIAGCQLVVDREFQKNAPGLYWFIILLSVVRMCYFSFYCCLVPTLYNCRWKGESRNANKLPLLRGDSFRMPILRRDYFTCFQDGESKCTIEQHGGPSITQSCGKIILQ